MEQLFNEKGTHYAFVNNSWFSAKLSSMVYKKLCYRMNLDKFKGVHNKFTKYIF